MAYKSTYHQGGTTLAEVNTLVESRGLRPALGQGGPPWASLPPLVTPGVPGLPVVRSAALPHRRAHGLLRGRLQAGRLLRRHRLQHAGPHHARGLRHEIET